METATATGDGSTTDSTTGSENYDHYNHYRGGSAPVMFHGPNGGTAKLIRVNSGNTNVIVVTQSTGDMCKYTLVKDSVNVYSCSKTGNTATLVTDTGGTTSVVVDIDGKKVVFSVTPPAAANTATSTVVQNTGGEINTTGAAINQEHMTTASGSCTANASTKGNSGANGIPKSQIPSGQEDLYILKSQIVPPICPKCPNPVIVSKDGNGKPPPPCPPCARCPEPAFDCKKVPNFTAFNASYMPVPAQSFSTFGV
jgi:hypothetical protein